MLSISESSGLKILHLVGDGNQENQRRNPRLLYSTLCQCTHTRVACTHATSGARKTESWKRKWTNWPRDWKAQFAQRSSFLSGLSSGVESSSTSEHCSTASEKRWNPTETAPRTCPEFTANKKPVGAFVLFLFFKRTKRTWDLTKHQV